MSAIQFWQGRLRKDAGTETQQGLVQSADWQRPSVKWGLGGAHTVLLVLLVIVGLGPILWLAKAAITPTQDTLSNPMAIFPHGFAWSNISDAWNEVDIGLYIWNTIVIAFGSWLCQIVVATTGAFALSVLRPKWGRRDHGRAADDAVRAVGGAARPALPRGRPPAADRPLVHQQLLGDLAAGRRQRLQRHHHEALLRQPPARDLRGGADRRRRSVPAVRLDRAADVKADPRRGLDLRRAGLVEGLPLAAAGPHRSEQAAGVGSPADDPGQTDLGVFLAAMLIACLVPIVGFLIFQRSFLRGTGLSGALKG